MNDDISAILSDPFFITTFNVVQIVGAYDADGLWNSTPTAVSVDGHIQPADGNLENLPEGVLAKDAIAIYTKTPIIAGNDNLERYQIEYKSKSYVVINVEDWSNYGYYKAVAVLKSHIHLATIPANIPSLPYSAPWAVTEVAVDDSASDDEYRIRAAFATISGQVATFSRTVKVTLGTARVFDTDQVTLLAEISGVTLLPNGQVDINTAGYSGKLLYLNYVY